VGKIWFDWHTEGMDSKGIFSDDSRSTFCTYFSVLIYFCFYGFSSFHFVFFRCFLVKLMPVSPFSSWRETGMHHYEAIVEVFSRASML
jgi:hypothetical protein